MPHLKNPFDQANDRLVDTMKAMWQDKQPASFPPVGMESMSDNEGWKRRWETATPEMRQQMMGMLGGDKASRIQALVKRMRPKAEPQGPFGGE